VRTFNKADMQNKLKGLPYYNLGGSASSKYAWRQAYKYKEAVLHLNTTNSHFYSTQKGKGLAQG